MVLCVDIGNSSVKFCLFDGTGRRSRVYKRDIISRSLLGNSLLPSALGDPERIRGAIISSVVPKLTSQVTREVERLSGRPPLLVDVNLHYPFRIAVPRPQTVGADRLCCAAGAIDARRSSAILIDVGSAVTVDLVLNAEFKGGIIMAGPAISLRTLAQNTAKLPSLEYRQPSRKHSSQFNSTESSLRLGAHLSTLGGIREAVRLLDKAAGRSLVKIVTGGAAKAISPSLPNRWKREPHLVLKGLYRIWELNAHQ